MKQLKIQLFLWCLIVVYPLSVGAQQTNMLYFLENSLLRHKLNPAFQPVNDMYFSLPVIGYTAFGIGNNSIVLNDVGYKENGKMVTFLNQPASINRFYKNFKSNTVLSSNLETNLFGLGFHHNSAYFTFSLTERMTGMLGLPRDAVYLSLYGTPALYDNSFNFSNFQADFSIYTEAAFGFAKDITPKWAVGGKFKILMGNANLSNTNKRVTFEAGSSNWNFKGAGTANYSSPVLLTVDDGLRSLEYKNPARQKDWIMPSGFGAGVDVGVEYHLNENVNLSAAIIDLGYIRWKKNALNVKYDVDYSFEGVPPLNSNSGLNTYSDVFDQLISESLLIDTLAIAFQGVISSNRTNKAYSTLTRTKLNLGVEYNLFNQLVSLGLLSHTRLYKSVFTEEITTSVNLRPYDWLNVSLGYSLINGMFSTFGAGLGMKIGFVKWFATADYIPVQKERLSLADIDSSFFGFNILIPDKSRVFNFAMGLNFVFDFSFKKQKYRRANALEQSTGLHTYSKERKRDLEGIYLKSGKRNIFNSKKGLLPTKYSEDCHCETN